MQRMYISTNKHHLCSYAWSVVFLALCLISLKQELNELYWQVIQDRPFYTEVHCFHVIIIITCKVKCNRIFILANYFS